MCGLLHKPWWPVIQKASLMLTPQHCCYSLTATGHSRRTVHIGAGGDMNTEKKTQGFIVAVNTVVNFAASDSIIISTSLKLF